MIKNNNIVFFIGFSFVVFISCNNSEKFQGFEKLSGKWKSEINNNLYFSENWEIENNKMVGEGFEIKNYDTLFREKLQVEIVNGKLIYIADVYGSKFPEMFTCIKKTDGSWLFENMEHDFPQKLHYNLKENELVIFLYGKENQNEIYDTIILKK